MRDFFILFVLYLLYKLVFNIILPVSKATSQMREKIREVQETQQRNTPPPPTPRERSSTTSRDADYIDFEEIK